MVITGYPPEDLLLKRAFIAENLRALKQVAEISCGLTVVIGFVDQDPRPGCTGKKDVLYNAAAVIDEGRLCFSYHKIHLPNYGVFDENRYFHPGRSLPVMIKNGVTIGINICEDIWYKAGPTQAQASGGGAQLIVNINASPYHRGKGQLREEMLCTRAKESGVYIAYVNMVGGQDELVFDGGSLVVDPKGRLCARAACFKEDLLTMDLAVDEVPPAAQEREKRLLLDFPDVKKWMLGGRKKQKSREVLVPEIAKDALSDDVIYQALVAGLSDYMLKNRFKKGVIGLSGGVDSALTAVIAVDALGKENVIAVFMPSRFTSRESIEDAEKLAKNLGIRLIKLPIESTMESYRSLLSGPFKGVGEDITEENLQSRIRGNIVMALSNKFGWLVLTTGNKSEMSVGYTTLYGDMAGGFAVIKDLWKTSVYQLVKLRNGRGEEVIPRRIIDRPPTAELRHNQTDQDSLPPYEILDPILRAYVEEYKHYQEIVAMGFEPETVSNVIALVDLSEFKRRQAPVGIKVTSRALGKDRRMPITNRYHRAYHMGEKEVFEPTKKNRREKIA